jgi:putative addiction module component (TIGR02574 family)
MTEHAQTVLKAAMALPKAEREEVAEMLLDSVYDDEPLTPEWVAEIDRRMKEIDEGRARLIPAEEVFAEVREMLRKKRNHDSPIR